MKSLFPLTDVARDEAYDYFDKNIRKLHKRLDGTVDPAARGLEDNDVDAFRHAYVSGVFTQEYGETVAEILGRLNEYHPFDLYSNSKRPGSLNMDLWNNSVGRKYGQTTKNREKLLELIHKAMKNGELILTPRDNRQYTGAVHNPTNHTKPVIVLKENKRGRNELFFDTSTKQVFNADEFIVMIDKGKYPGYTVKLMNGSPTPISKPDNRETNNLG